MKYVRIAVVILLIASLGIYGAGVVREKQGEDPTRPVITSDREVLEIPVSYEEADLLEGLSASDERDGDLTDQILVGEFSQFVEKGVCNVSYVVFDSSNQAATLSRQVRFTDYVSPRITLSEPLVFTEGQTESAIERIGASDVLDGDITSLVRQNESDIDYRTAGDYSITVEVTNSFGDLETETLPVHVVEPSRLGLEIGLTPISYTWIRERTLNPTAMWNPWQTPMGTRWIRVLYRRIPVWTPAGGLLSGALLCGKRKRSGRGNLADRDRPGVKEERMGDTKEFNLDEISLRSVCVDVVKNLWVIMLPLWLPGSQ